MCIIAICEKRKLTYDEFETCFLNNGDGVGFGWLDSEGFVNYKKGFMELKDAYDAYKELDVLPHVVHFRLSSCGGVVPDLTHPFIVSESSPIRLVYKGKQPILFHNGVIASWREMLLEYMLKYQILIKNKHVSDTRWAAIALHTHKIIGHNLVKTLDDWNGKYAVVTTEGIIRSTKGFEEESKGIVFSNSGYKNAWKKSKGTVDATYCNDSWVYGGRGSDYYRTHHWDNKKQRYVENESISVDTKEKKSLSKKPEVEEEKTDTKETEEIIEGYIDDDLYATDVSRLQWSSEIATVVVGKKAIDYKWGDIVKILAED